MPTGDDVEVQQPSVPTSGPRPGSQTRSRRRRGRLLAIVTVVLMVVGVVLLLGPFAYARANVSSHLHDSATGVSDVPAVPVAIVFGAGLTRAGTPSPFLAQRIDVAVELYRAKKVRALLMSGDNSRADSASRRRRS